jgi:molecular chaperone DnaJ
MLDVPRSRFHIIIDPSLCLAFGGCETISPRVFTVDKNKRINPKAKVLSETADSLERIVLAAQACPTKAISIIDRYTGDQIYP